MLGRRWIESCIGLLLGLVLLWIIFSEIGVRTRQRSSSDPERLVSVELDQDTLVFASVSGLPPKFIDSGPEKGLGWAEVQTQAIRKGLLQEGFKVKQEWMTPARIAHEFRLNHPICTFPVEWNHPERLFQKKPDRIYSIALTLAEQESRTILFNKKDSHRFSKHLDQKGDLDLESLFQDKTLKTVLVRDKDYGFITQRLTEINENGEQEVREEFKTHVSLLVVKDNRQLIEMLHAERFDYSFSELDDKELKDSKLESGDFGHLPYDTIHVKDSRDPNLVQISVTCSLHPLSLRAMPFINHTIASVRGVKQEFKQGAYRALLENKEISKKSTYGALVTFHGLFESGAFDTWFKHQKAHFPKLEMFPLEPKKIEEPLQGTRNQKFLKWILAEEAPGEFTLFNEASTGLRPEFNTNINSYPPELLNYPIERMAEYLSPAQIRLLNGSMPFQNQGSYSSIQALSQIARNAKTDPKKLTIFGSGMNRADVESLLPLILSPKLTDLSFMGGSGESVGFLMDHLPRTIKRLNLASSTLLRTSFPRGIQDLSVAELHLNDAQLTEAQLYELLTALPQSIEKLSLGFQRRAWTSKTAKAFGDRRFPRLKFLDLENGFLFDTEFKLLLEGIPSGLEELRLAYNHLTPRSLKTFLDRKWSALQALDLSGNSLGFVADPGKLAPLILPRNVKSLWVQDCGLSDENLKWVVLPEQLSDANFSNNALGDKGLLTLLEKLEQNISRLYLSNTRISDASMDAIAKKGFQKIADLHLGTNRLNNSAIEKLSSSSFLLERLSFPDNRLTNTGAIVIAKKWAKQLQSLDLSGNPISNLGVQALAETWSEQLVDLRLGSILSLNGGDFGNNLPGRMVRLNLSGNQFSNVDLEELAAHLPPTLEDLDLGESRLNERGIRFLVRRNLPALHRLNLLGTPLGSSGLMEATKIFNPSLRKLSLGHASLNESETIRFAESIPTSLIHLQLKLLKTFPNSDVLAKHFPESLRELFLIATPFFLSSQWVSSFHFPSGMRDFELDGSDTDDKSFCAIAKAIPASIEEFETISLLPLSGGAFNCLSASALGELRSLSLGGHRISPAQLAAVQRLGSGFRVLAFEAVHWKNPAQFDSFDATAFTHTRLMLLSNFSFPKRTVASLVSKLPQEFWMLGLNSVGLRFEDVPPLIRALPKYLRILNISGNDFGQSGLELFRAYKAQREKEEGIAFTLIE